MRNFISSLLKKHEHGLVHTAFITDATDRMTLNGINAEDVSIIKSSFNFLKDEIERNSEKEEAYFFPIFAEAIDRTKIEKMKKEHKLLKSNLTKMENILSSVAENTGKEYISSFKETTKEFSKILKEHFIEEKDFLFMIAWKNLPEHDINNIFKRKV